MQNAEHFEFMTQTNELIPAETPVDLDVEVEYPVFKAALADEDRSFRIIAKSPLTQGIGQGDSERDGYLTGFGAQVKAALTHYDPEVADAAYRLKVLTDGYGRLASESYDRETAGIYNLVQDLRSAKYLPDVQKAGLETWVDKLEASNQAFDQMMKQRYSEQSEKDSITRLRAARLTTDEAYAAIRNKINAGIVFNGPAKYQAFVLELNTRIDRFNTAIAQRRGRAAAAKSQESAPETPD